MDSSISVQFFPEIEQKLTGILLKFDHYFTASFLVHFFQLI